jgi:hypothetical protein
MVVVVSVGWSPLDQAAKEQKTKELDQLVEPLRELNPDSGAYINEVSFCPNVELHKLILSRPTLMNQTGSKLSGAQTTLVS